MACVNLELGAKAFLVQDVGYNYAVSMTTSLKSAFLRNFVQVVVQYLCICANDTLVNLLQT